MNEVFLSKRESLRERAFKIKSDVEFEDLALEIFKYQSEYNLVYKAWLEAIKLNKSEIRSSRDIPSLPISFFKTHRVVSGDLITPLEFCSSGTTGTNTSTHYIYDEGLYRESFIRGFERVYGDLKEWTIIGLLPSYLERKNSSLVYMVQGLMEASNQDKHLFYLDDYTGLIDNLLLLAKEKKKVWLIGVSFALLDLAKYAPPVWENLIVVETGGMKGRRKEMIREELHNEIRAQWNVQAIHSEYGMTELLSQAWMTREGQFKCPPWMKIQIRDTSDPWSEMPEGKSGGIRVIDLCNIDSCSFIETSDLGNCSADGSFNVTGRFDNSDLRGCNLLIVNT